MFFSGLNKQNDAYSRGKLKYTHNYKKKKHYFVLLKRITRQFTLSESKVGNSNDIKSFLFNLKLFFFAQYTL